MKKNRLKSCGNTRPAGPEEGARGPAMRVLRMTAIATRKVVQLRDSAWDAVVKSVDKGTFFIRRRKELLSGACPLRGYEVCRVENDGTG